jgi:hypothetical protein
VPEPVESAELLDGGGVGWVGAAGLDEPDGLVDGDGDPDADGDGVGDVAGAGAVAEAEDFDGVGHCTADPVAADTVTDEAGVAGPAVISAD